MPSLGGQSPTPDGIWPISSLKCCGFVLRSPTTALKILGKCLPACRQAGNLAQTRKSWYYYFVEFVKKLWIFFVASPKGQLIPLVVVLAVSGYFYFNNLGTDYITLWDEAVHINVVKNLSQDPWPPKLHLTDIGIDFQDWTNNYIWVHKPLAPLYLQAVFYKINPSLFAFRLPSAIFALISITALFFVARRHFGYAVAVTSASLFAFSPYVFELVKGRQFSGLHDLMFCFFGILALGRVLRITELSSRPTRSASEEAWRDPLNIDDTSNKGFLDSPSKPSGSLGMTRRKHYLWFGVFAGLAFLSKGGLALLFFPALFMVSKTADGWKRGLLNFLYAGLTMLIIILPEKLGLFLLYPAEYYFEQNTQTLHLLKELEYWGRPWDYYLTIYLREMLLPYLYVSAVAAIIFGLWAGFKKPISSFNLNTVQYLSKERIFFLTIWVLSFLVPLSFGLTKISNFIFAALPAMLMLTALMFKRLWEQKHYAAMFALSATTILSYIIIRLDVRQVKYHLFQTNTAFERFQILLYAALLFAALWMVYRLLEKGFHSMLPKRAERVGGRGQGSKIAMVLSLFLILGTYARANRLSDIKPREGYQYQEQIKRAALELKEKYTQDAIFLINFPNLPKGHLYFQYWSGLDTMEIYDRQPIFVLKKTLPHGRPVFVLSDEPLKQGIGGELPEQHEFGYLYRLEDCLEDGCR